MRANRGRSRPTSVFRTTIGVCKILSRSVEIWQYEGQKPDFGRQLEAFRHRKPPPRQLIPQNSYNNSPHPAVVKIPYKNSWICTVIRISTRIQSFAASLTPHTSKEFHRNSSTFELSGRQTSRQTRNMTLWRR